MKKIVCMLILSVFVSSSAFGNEVDLKLAQIICDGIKSDMNSFNKALLADTEKSKFDKFSYIHLKDLFTKQAGMFYNMLLELNKKKIKSEAKIKEIVLDKCIIKKPKKKDTVDNNQWVKIFVNIIFAGRLNKVSI